MLLKPKCPVIAIEEHYWDAEMAAHFTGVEAGRPGETQRRLDDKRTAGRRATVGRVLWAQPVSARVATSWLQTVLFPGRRFLSAFEELHRVTRHDGRNRVLVYKLRMTVAPQQQTEIVEPGDNPLQLHPIDQKDRQWRLGFANVI